MSTFKTSLRIVAAHWMYVLVYLVWLAMLGLLTVVAQSGDASDRVEETTVSVAVIDRDGSTISQGIKRYVESVGEAQELEDSERAMQDATAHNRIDYILIIPAGYGQEVRRAARAGGEPPRMDSVIGYESASGALMNVRIDSYAGQVVDYLSVLAEDPARAVALADETTARSVPAQRIARDATPLPHDLVVYAQFSLYPLVAFAVVAISALMTALGRRAVRSRLAAAPVSGGSRGLGLLGACLVIGVVGWLWIFGLGIAVFGAGSVTASAPLLGVVGAALGAYTLVAVAVGFLIGQLGLGSSAANAVANIGGMARGVDPQRLVARRRRRRLPLHARLLGGPGDLRSAHRRLNVRRHHWPPAGRLRRVRPVRARHRGRRPGRGPHPGPGVGVRPLPRNAIDGVGAAP